MSSFSLPFVGAGGEPVDFIATINSHGIASLPPMKPNADLANELQITLRLPDRSLAARHTVLYHVTALIGNHTPSPF